MILMLRDVRHFYLKMNWPIPENETLLGPERQGQRVGHLREELSEFLQAESAVDQADALIDVCYIALGTMLERGIHRTNVINAQPPFVDGMALVPAERVVDLYDSMKRLVDAYEISQEVENLYDLVRFAACIGHEYGLDWFKAWERVHEANMSKLPGNSNRHGAYEAIKPDGFVGPDLSDLCQGAKS